MRNARSRFSRPNGRTQEGGKDASVLLQFISWQLVLRLPVALPFHVVIQAVGLVGDRCKGLEYDLAGVVLHGPVA